MVAIMSNSKQNPKPNTPPPTPTHTQKTEGNMFYSPQRTLNLYFLPDY